LPAFVLGGVSVYVLINRSKIRQQKSFGRDQEKATLDCAAAGHTTFAEAGLRAPWGNFCGPRFLLICRAKAPCGKEASLLT
jgi:hypothetical protein